MVSGVLISIATSMKLPLSTTYVTFMVAMGTSLADRAWGRESAVYRVAGVINVIGGWFMTALVALLASGIVVFLIRWNKEVMIPVLLLLTVLLLIKNFLKHKQLQMKTLDPKKLKKSKSRNIQGIISESADNIINVIERTIKISNAIINGISTYDTDLLKKSKNGVQKLDSEIEELRDNLFYFIKNLDEKSLGSSKFYITILGYLTDIAQSLDYISRKSFKHVNNQHLKLKFNQIKDIQYIFNEIEKINNDIIEVLSSRKFDRISLVLLKKETIKEIINTKIDIQVDRTRTEESSPKNTTLYFNILLEVKDLTNSIFKLIEVYYNVLKK